MRIAVLYDIHGNLPALDAVLDTFPAIGLDRVIVGGDVLPGPMPRACMARLLDLDLPVAFIRGNGDRAVLAHMRREPLTVPEAARPAIHWTADQLPPAYEAVLAGWPATLQFDVPGLGGVLFCHATASNDTDIVTRRTSDEHMRSAFDGVTASVVICGHTHMPFDRRVASLRIVNAGSVGMPFGRAGAHWLLLGGEDGIEPRLTLYDLAAAADRIRATDFPGAAGFADRNVLNPPSEDEMLDLYSPIEPSP